LKKYLREFSLEIEKRLKSSGISCRTITVKIKYYDFKNITRSITLPNSTCSSKAIYEQAEQILEQRIDLSVPIRLIGLQVSNLVYPDEPIQISIDSWINTVCKMEG